MADELSLLESWVAPLLAKLTPPERRRLALAMAREMRQHQQQTMRAQSAPDGTAWEPRKPPARSAQGAIRRRAQAAKARKPMMRGLTRPKWLNARATAQEATVGFVGRAQRIAALHHRGGVDNVTPDGPTYDYPARQLLGFPDELRENLRDMLAQHLTG